MEKENWEFHPSHGIWLITKQNLPPNPTPFPSQRWLIMFSGEHKRSRCSSGLGKKGIMTKYASFSNLKCLRMKHAAWPLDILLVQCCRSIHKFEPYLLLSAFSPSLLVLCFSEDNMDDGGCEWFSSVVLCRAASKLALSWLRSSRIRRDFSSSSARRLLCDKQRMRMPR